jgi:hypothetical protein
MTEAANHYGTPAQRCANIITGRNPKTSRWMLMTAHHVEVREEGRSPVNNEPRRLAERLKTAEVYRGQHTKILRYRQT